MKAPSSSQPAFSPESVAAASESFPSSRLVIAATLDGSIHAVAVPSLARHFLHAGSRYRSAATATAPPEERPGHHPVGCTGSDPADIDIAPLALDLSAVWVAKGRGGQEAAAPIFSSPVIVQFHDSSDPASGGVVEADLVVVAHVDGWMVARLLGCGREASPRLILLN